MELLLREACLQVQLLPAAGLALLYCTLPLIFLLLFFVSSRVFADLEEVLVTGLVLRLL